MSSFSRQNLDEFLSSHMGLISQNLVNKWASLIEEGLTQDLFTFIELADILLLPNYLCWLGFYSSSVTMFSAIYSRWMCFREASKTITLELTKGCP